MITKSISISTKTIEGAPKYLEDYTPIRMEHSIIVKKGTETGRATVDIQCIDAKGNKYLIMTTGAILKNLAIMIGENEPNDI